MARIGLSQSGLSYNMHERVSHDACAATPFCLCHLEKCIGKRVHLGSVFSDSKFLIPWSVATPLWKNRTSPSPMLGQEVTVRERLLLVLGCYRTGPVAASPSSERINDQVSLLHLTSITRYSNGVGSNVPSIDPHSLLEHRASFDTCTSTDRIQLGKKPILETDLNSPYVPRFVPRWLARYLIHTRYPVSIFSMLESPPASP